MNTRRLLTLVATLALLSSSQLCGQDEGKTNAKKDDHAIEDFAWIVGHWTGEAMGGAFEETWNAPFGGTMMGMFKFVQDDKVGFYEILTIVEEDGNWLIRLKHFDKALVGWEEKDESMEFPLVSLSDTEAIFDGLKFLKIDDNTMHILVTTKRGDEVDVLKFVCKRGETPAGK